MAPKEENKMGIMPINKLLINMSLPLIISMLVQALYNIVDSIFVSQINENALTAVSLAFPMQNLLISIAVGTGVGINAYLSKNLGAKNFEKANATAENGIFVFFLSYLVFLVLGLTISKSFFAIQTNDKQVIEYGEQYLSVCLSASIGVFMQILFERLLQATGRSFYSMLTQGLGAIINIILDPIFIFGLYGVPKMGVRGAAIATVIGQICAGFLAIYFNVTKNPDITINIKKFKPNLHIIGRIYSVGVPSIIMSSISSVLTFGLNKILIKMTQTAVAVFGVYFKLQSFAFMPVFGLNTGMVPIIAYNYGAKKPERILKTVKLSSIYAVSYMALALITMQIFPKQLLEMFNASSTMMELGVVALRTISICFVFAGFCIVLGSLFQAMGNGVLSMFVSVARQLVILLPVAYLLSLSGEVDKVWLAFPIAEIMSTALSVIFFIRVYKKEIKPLYQ